MSAGGGILVGFGCRRLGLYGKKFRPMCAGGVRLLVEESEAEEFLAQQRASSPMYEFKVTLRAIVATVGRQKRRRS